MLDEEKVTSDMMKLIRKSNVPKFIREIEKVDRAMIVGGCLWWAVWSSRKCRSYCI